MCNGSFESPSVGANGQNQGLNALTGVSCWTANSALEIWNGNFGGMLAQDQAQHLEINANTANQTVSQVVTNLNTNCQATLCFYYTGRYPNPLNNRFEIILPGSGLAPVTLTPVSYGVGGWQLYTVSFVPVSSAITIQFHGFPADGNAGGAHIDNVSFTQCCPVSIPCWPPALATVRPVGANVQVIWNGSGRLEATDSLSSGVWFPVANTSPFTTSAIPGGFRFFRVVCP